MSESLVRIEKFLATRRTMRSIDHTAIAQLNVGGTIEAQLLTADLEQLVKLAALAIRTYLAPIKNRATFGNHTPENGVRGNRIFGACRCGS